jgi:hypothetical protein
MELFFNMVVMKIGGEKYFWKSVFRTGDDGTVFNDCVILTRGDERYFPSTWL